VLWCGAGGTAETVSGDELPQLQSETTVSPLDGETQPLFYWAPEEATNQPTPLFVFLHSWSADFRQDNSKWLAECVRRRWIWLHPNFRGVNNSRKACGSRFARQDILDAMEFARGRWNIDRERIYLAGVSGGGHMSLLMAGHHPDQFSAVSSWVGPTDLADWHRIHTKDGQPQKYAQMIEASLGGPPGASEQIDNDYRDRSPVFHLHQTGDLPVSILAGVEDGHTGSVPIRHSLRAFNVIAKSHGSPLVSDAEMEQLSTQKTLLSPTAEDTATDSALGRTIFLRRKSGNSVITIFEGGHESVPPAAFEWLSQQRRKVSAE
jgi:dipeptidyl aminopeptidase/acylaminoacyl peptidase